MDATKRREAIQKLNNRYFELTATGENQVPQTEAYKILIGEESYRYLNGYSYSIDPLPLRSGRIASMPPFTEVKYKYHLALAS